MDNRKIETAIKVKIVALTKIIMNLEKCNESNAYKRLTATSLYSLILDKKTGLYLEPIEFLAKAYEIELNKSKDDMIQYINQL